MNAAQEETYRRFREMGYEFRSHWDEGAIVMAKIDRSCDTTRELDAVKIDRHGFWEEITKDTPTP